MTPEPDSDMVLLRIVLAVLALMAAVVIAWSGGPLSVPGLPALLYGLERLFRWAFGDAVKPPPDLPGPEPPPPEDTAAPPRALAQSAWQAVKAWRDSAGLR